MADIEADAERESETDRTEQLKSVYLSVTDGDAAPTVEHQREESSNREIRSTGSDRAVGPAELHGLDDAIDDPDPSNASS
ncbi:hypothetical protein [Halopiger thermotolerans]